MKAKNNTKTKGIIKFKKLISIAMAACLSLSLLGVLSSDVFKTKRVAASTVSTMQAAHELDGEWTTYLGQNPDSGKFAGKRPIEFMDFLQAGLGDGSGNLGLVWVKDLNELLPNDGKYYFVIASAVELMYFSLLANNFNPASGTSFTAQTIDELIKNSDIYLGNNIFYGGREYWLDGKKIGFNTKVANVSNPNEEVDFNGTNANYHGATYPFSQITGFNGTFDGQGFEIYDLKMEISDGSSDYAMFCNVGSNAVIRNFGLVNAEVKGATELTLSNDVHLIANSYPSSAEQGQGQKQRYAEKPIERLYAVGTRYVNIAAGGFTSCLVAGAAAEYYILGSHYEDMSPVTMQAESYTPGDDDTPGLTEPLSNVPGAADAPVWYATTNDIGFLSGEPASPDGYYTPFDDNPYIGTYQYARLQGIRKSTGNINIVYTNLSGSFTSFNGGVIYRPADLIYYLNNHYKTTTATSLSVHVAIVANDLDLGGVSNRAYVAARTAAGTVNSGLIGYNGYAIGSPITVNSNNAGADESSPSYSRNVKIYNYFNKTYRMAGQANTTANAGADTSAIVTGLIEANTAAQRTVFANVNFMNGYNRLPQEAFEGNIQRVDLGGSFENEFIRNTTYYCGLGIRTGTYGAALINAYYNVDTYAEYSDSNYINTMYMGAMIAYNNRANTDNTTSSIDLAARCVVSGRVDGGSAMTVSTNSSTPVSSIYVGGIYGYYSSAVQYSIYDRVVFSGEVYGFKPRSSNAPASDTLVANTVSANVYTGGFAGLFNAGNNVAAKQVHSVLVTGTVQTYALMEDSTPYRYSNSLNFYTGGMIGQDSSVLSLAANEGYFRFAGDLVLNTNYTKGNASTGHTGADVYTPRYYMGMYSGNKTTSGANIGSETRKMIFSQDYDVTELAENSDYDDIVLAGSFYSLYREDISTFDSKTSADNQITLNNKITLNDPLTSLYFGVFAGTGVGNYYSIENRINVQVNGYMADSDSLVTSADGNHAQYISVAAISGAGTSASLTDIINVGEIGIKDLKIGTTSYVSGLAYGATTLTLCANTVDAANTRAAYVYAYNVYMGTTNSSTNLYISGFVYAGNSIYDECKNTEGVTIEAKNIVCSTLRVSGFDSYRIVNASGSVNYASVTAENVYRENPVGTLASANVYVSGVGYQTYDNAITVKDIENRGAVAAENIRGSAYLGGVFGALSADKTLKNLKNYGEIKYSQTSSDSPYDTAPTVHIGGLVRTLSVNTQLEDCVNYGNITATGAAAGIWYIGGIAGYLANADSAISETKTLTRCVNMGSISMPELRTAVTYAGGIVGYAHSHPSTLTLNDCINGVPNNDSKGKITLESFKNSTASIGGMIGYNIASAPLTLNRCINYAKITALIPDNGNTATTMTTINIGGLVGHKGSSSSSIIFKSCINAGEVVADSSITAFAANQEFHLNMGGIAGYLQDGSCVIYDSVNTAKVWLDTKDTHQVTSPKGIMSKIGGIIGYLHSYADLRSVMNYGDIANGWATGGIIGNTYTRANYINGAVNYGEITSQGFYIIEAGNLAYAAGVGGIIGVHSTSNADAAHQTNLYNLLNYGRVSLNNTGTYINHAGGLIGFRKNASTITSMSGYFANASTTFNAFKGGLYVIYDTTPGFADRLVGNMDSYDADNLAIAYPDELSDLFDRDNADFFWSPKNEQTYQEAPYITYNNSGGAESQGQTKAINLPQIVWSEQAMYVENGRNGQAGPEGQKRGIELGSKKYIFALTASEGRRDGIYEGDNFTHAISSVVDDSDIDNITTVNYGGALEDIKIYLKQITLSRDAFVDHHALGGDSTNFDVIDTTAGRNTAFDNNSITEKLDDNEETDDIFDDTIVAIYYPDGPYVSATSQKSGDSFVFDAFNDANGKANVSLVKNNPLDTNIFSDGSNYKIIEEILPDDSEDPLNHYLRDYFQNGVTNETIVVCYGTVYVWQGTEPANLKNLTEDEKLYVHEYKIFIVYVDSGSDLEFIKANEYDISKSTTNPEKTYAEANADSTSVQAEEFDGEEFDGRDYYSAVKHTFDDNDPINGNIVVDSRENVTIEFIFEGNGLTEDLTNQFLRSAHLYYGTGNDKVFANEYDDWYYTSKFEFLSSTDGDIDEGLIALQEVLGITLPLRARVTFTVTFNLNKDAGIKFDELAHHSGGWTLSFDVFKNITGEDTADYFQQSFTVNKQKSTDTTLYRHSITGNNNTTSAWFIDGRDGTIVAQNISYNTTSTTFTYPFGYVPAFTLFNGAVDLNGNGLADEWNASIIDNLLAADLANPDNPIDSTTVELRREQAKSALIFFNNTTSNYIWPSEYATVAVDSVTLTPNANGTHTSVLAFTVTAEDGISTATFTFTFNETLPTMSNSRLMIDNAGVETGLTGRAVRVERGEGVKYALNFTYASGNDAVCWQDINGKVAYRMLLDGVEIFYDEEGDYYYYLEGGTPGVKVFYVGEKKYYCYLEGGVGGVKTLYENLVIPKIILKEGIDNGSGIYVEFTSETTGGEWVIQPYFKLHTDYSITDYEYKIGGFTYKQPNGEDMPEEYDGNDWAQWKYLIPANTDFTFTKVASKLCYIEYMDIYTTPSVGITSQYYLGGNLTPFDGLVYTGEEREHNAFADFNGSYRQAKYNYLNLDVITNETLRVSATRISRFQNLFNIPQSFYDIEYSTYVVIALSNLDDGLQKYNDRYTTLSYSYDYGQLVDEMTFENIEDTYISGDGQWRYFRLRLDETTAIQPGGDNTISIRVRVTAENKSFYTDYNLVFSIPPNNKGINFNLSYKPEGDDPQEFTANFGLRTKKPDGAFDRSVNMMFIRNDNAYDNDNDYDYFILKGFKASYAGGLYTNTYRTRNFPADSYYFYADMPVGYAAKIVSIKVGDYTYKWGQDGTNQWVNPQTGVAEDCAFYLKIGGAAQGDAEIYIPTDLSYIKMDGPAPSTVYINMEIYKSVSPPHWGIIV